MASDCTVKIDDGLLNVRVGAIILKDGKFLMVKNDREKYFYSVGGRIKFGETAQEAVVREVLEETGVRMEIDRLGFVHEHFFKTDAQDDEKGREILVYEISFFFYMKTPENFEPVCKSFTENGCKETVEWISFDSDAICYPEFFKTELKNPQKNVKHLVTGERKS